MGLFSKSVTAVGTSVMRAIEDTQLPDAIRSGFINSSWNDDSQLIENIMEAMVGGIGVKATRMHEYGRKTYLYGLPTAHLQSSTDALPQVKAVIEAQQGGPVNINYYHFGAPNLMHIAWYTLMNNFGYNSTTNEIVTLTNSKAGKKVYLKDMHAVVNDATLPEKENGSLDQWTRTPNWGFTPERPMSSGGITFLSAHSVFKVTPTPQDFIKVDYVWEEPVNAVTNGVAVVRKEIREGTFNILVSGYIPNTDWHQVEYTRNGVIQYFMYGSGAGTYPTIDNVHKTQHNNLGDFFPFTYFRFNKTAQNLDKNSLGYKHSKKITRYLGMDFDTICDGINSNPDIADVEQAMMMMSVPADTTNPMEVRYLYDFFKALHGSKSGQPGNPNGIDADTPLQQLISKQLKASSPEGNIIIQDKRFKMALSYSSISKTLQSGNLGPVGTYTGGYTKIETVITGEDLETGTSYSWSSFQPCHTYRRQISEVAYEEIKVYDLKMTYHIFGEYTTVADEEDKILLVPLDMFIVGEYSIPDRELLYARSLHYVFNSRVVTKLKWYQTPLFRAIILIIAIVLTVLDLGSDGGSWIAAALAVTGYTAVVITIIFNIIVGKLIAAAFKLFVKVFGIKIAFVLAIVAIIYGAYNVFDFGSVIGAPWAAEMLNVANGLITAALEDKYNDLLAQQDQFKLFVDEQEKLLDTANKLLESTNFLTPAIIFGEKPYEFYERTIHSGNIGVLSFDALSSYVDNALTLPKITQTLGETQNDW